MAVRLLKGSWWVDFQWRKQRCRRRSPINTKGAAQQYEAWLRHELLQRGSLDHLDAKPTKKTMAPTLAEFAVRWLREYVDVNNGRSERYNKRKSLRSKLLSFFGEYRLDEITVNEVEQFKAHLLGLALNPKTINNHLTILNRCLGSARDWGLIADVPKIRVLRTTKPPFRFLTPSDAERLIEAIDDDTLRAMVRTGIRAGLRYSELRGLHWEDVDFERAQLTVQHAYILKEIGPTKNYRARHIPMTRDLADELRALPRTSHLVFPVREKHSRQLELLKIECELAGVPTVGWHALRHTFASHLMTAGAPVHAVQALLGHSSIEMTMRYSHLAPGVLHSAISLMERRAEKMSAGRQPEANSPPFERLLATDALPFLRSDKPKSATFQ